MRKREGFGGESCGRESSRNAGTPRPAAPRESIWSRDGTMSATPSTIELASALKLVDSIEKQAAKSTDPHVKRILLASGCQIIDHILKASRKVA